MGERRRQKEGREENQKGEEDDSLSFLCCVFEQEGRTEELRREKNKEKERRG
jgi:hypothetical protein